MSIKALRLNSANQFHKKPCLLNHAKFLEQSYTCMHPFTFALF